VAVVKRKRFLKMEFFAFGLPLVVILAFWFMAIASKEGRAIGLIDGQLARCTEKPNCICTEYPDDASHYAEPIVIPSHMDNPEEISQLVKAVIEEAGGDVQIQSNSYLSAVFESRFLGFIDDVEVRIDLSRGRIYLRSASRVGYSDLGANLKRVNRLTKLFAERVVRH